MRTEVFRVMLFYLIVFKFSRVTTETSVSESIAKLCVTLKTLDSRISKTLLELPKYEGEYLVKDLKDYNSALTNLLQFLDDHRETTLELQEAKEILQEGAPDYFGINIDPDKAQLNFGWLHKGMDEVFKLRAESIRIWSLLNRMSRLIPLQFYSYPKSNMSDQGYINPDFPPIKEKMTAGSKNE